MSSVCSVFLKLSRLLGCNNWLRVSALRTFVCCEIDLDFSFKPHWTLRTHSFSYVHMKLAAWNNVTSIPHSRNYKLQEGRFIGEEPRPPSAVVQEIELNRYKLNIRTRVFHLRWSHLIVNTSDNPIRRKIIRDPGTRTLPPTPGKLSWVVSCFFFQKMVCVSITVTTVRTLLGWF